MNVHSCSEKVLTIGGVYCLGNRIRCCHNEVGACKSVRVCVADFKDLFPTRRLSDQDFLTVITICQKTSNDMTGWSSEVESEREQLLQEASDITCFASLTRT